MNIIVNCKQENHTIIDKIQPCVSRTEIKGILVFNEGGRDTLIFSYIHRLGSFLGFKILNLTIFFFFFFLGGGGGGQKKYFFCGYEDFVDIFGGSSQNWTIFMGHFYVYSEKQLKDIKLLFTL